jgi:uroporphyrinogen-III synthase
MNTGLQGKGILVTRSPHQSEQLNALIVAEAGRPISFPVLEILDAQDLSPLHQIIDALDVYQLAIFISPNAVNKAMNLIRGRRAMPAGLRVAAIGRGSQRELKHFGLSDIIVPEGRFDSEALLALPALQEVAGWQIVIFRGDGGRELLGDELTRRGAQVRYAECYRRARPDADAGQLLRLWSRGEIHGITVTSTEGLRNLYEMVGKLGRQWLKTTPLFVPHERILAAARELGLQRGVLTEAGDDGLVAGMKVFFDTAHGH